MWRQTHRDRPRVKTEAEGEGRGCEPRNAEDCWQPVEAGKGRKDSPPERSEGAWPRRHLDFRLL